MKYIGKLSVLLLLASCTNEALQDAPAELEIPGNDEIICSIAPDEETRTSLSGNNLPVWNSGDEISVLDAGGKHKAFELVSGEGTATGTFRGVLPAGNSLYALYPYKENNSFSNNRIHFKKKQSVNGVEGSFSPDENVMVASFQSQNPSLQFKNVFGLLKLQLKGTASIGRITLTSNNANDVLWGDFTLAANGNQGTDNQTLSGSNGTNEVSLDFTSAVYLSASTVKSFYFVLPAGTLASGFSIDIYDKSGNLVYSRTSSKNQTISRSKILVLPVIDDVNRPADTLVEPEPFSWVAYNNNARTGTADQTVIDPQTSGYPSRKSDKYTGMFYFIWHTSWSAAGREPHDTQSVLGAGNYGYNPYWNFDGSSLCGGVPHHWGKSYFDYYRDDDAWVLRKQAQLLSDAGIDFIVFDATNNVFYEAEVLNLMRVWKEVRDEGGKTPQIVYMIWHSKGYAGGDAMESYANYNHNVAITTVYNNIYAAHPEYSDLWFKWEGKPLMLAMGEHVTNSTVRNFFTFRRSWYLWNNNWQTDVDAGDPWWGNGEDRWPWGCAYTDNGANRMKAGTHNGVNECVSVSPATHPVSNIGRSFQIGNSWQTTKTYSGNPNYPKEPAKGIYFKQQFAAAQELDPKVIFFTGWNEYLVGHATAPAIQFQYMCGVNAYGHALFIDQYNYEFSRDIEPISGELGDNYYYYMVDFIRQFKGVDELPEYSTNRTISIDGKFADWINVESCYADDKGDTKWRGYDRNNGNGWYGFNTNTIYVNKTGRNDLNICKVANDSHNLNFYVDAVGNLTGYNEGNKGLNLYITTNSAAANWEGFNYALWPTSSTKATLFRCTGGWNWEQVSADINIAVNGKAMEVAIPLNLLGFTNPDRVSVDFKWIDNVDVHDGNGIQRCMRDGDSAPNGRFRYRYVFKK